MAIKKEFPVAIKKEFSVSLTRTHAIVYIHNYIVPIFVAFVNKIDVSLERISIWVKRYPEFRQAYNKIQKLLQFCGI